MVIQVEKQILATPKSVQIHYSIQLHLCNGIFVLVNLQRKQLCNCHWDSLDTDSMNEWGTIKSDFGVGFCICMESIQQANNSIGLMLHLQLKVSIWCCFIIIWMKLQLLIIIDFESKISTNVLTNILTNVLSNYCSLIGQVCLWTF